MSNHSPELRILFVTPRYFPYMGGVETHVYEVARRLASAGVDTTVLTADLSGQLPPVEVSAGVKVHRVRAWPANRDYYFAPAVSSFIRKGQWDLVHVQSYHTLMAPLAMWSSRQAGIPYMVTFHGGGHSSALRNRLRGLQYRLLRPLLAKATRLVAVAQFEVDFYSQQLQLPRERFVVIPNGADMPPVGQVPTSPKERTVIASVGRLERYKGHQRLISALPRLRQLQPDVHLWIAGKGPYEADLRLLAQKLGVQDRVEIRAIPATERAAMASELAQAALVALLSDYETHPIAALEALALGRPVLVTDTSGLGELAARGLARAIPLNSTPEQVAEAAYAQLRDPLIPQGGFTLPTWDDCANGLLSLYRTAI